MIWLAIHGRLKTHDKMSIWDNSVNLKFVLCNKVPDSHYHLFFDCEATGMIWANVKGLDRLNHAPNRWSEIISYLLVRPINKSIWSILQRLLIGASLYYVWQERNFRIFQNHARSMDDICRIIKDFVRLRLLGLNFNASAQVYEAACLWKFQVKRVIGKKKIMLMDER